MKQIEYVKIQELKRIRSVSYVAEGNEGMKEMKG